MGANRSFSNAVDQMRAGKAVRRAAWIEQDPFAYIYITKLDGKEAILFHKHGSDDGLYSPIQEDLLADDWELVV